MKVKKILNWLNEYENKMYEDSIVDESGFEIYEVDLENITREPAIEIEKIFNFCELSWDIKCLEFYKNKNITSKTASNIQFRKAVYKDSINKYLPYKQFLSKYGNKYSWFN